MLGLEILPREYDRLLALGVAQILLGPPQRQDVAILLGLVDQLIERSPEALARRRI